MTYVDIRNFSMYDFLPCCDKDFDIKAYIEKKITAFCQNCKGAAKSGLAIRAGICKFKAGTLIADTLETAEIIKGKEPTEKCI